MSFVIKLPLAAALAVLTLSAPAWAQVVAQQPYPHAATCADFHHHHANDTWSPKVEIQITSGSGTVSLGPSNTITADQVIGGDNLGKWLETNCVKSKD